MPKFIVRLWGLGASLEFKPLDAELPMKEIEASTELEAAALGLWYFKQAGHEVALFPSAHVTVSLHEVDEIDPDPIFVREVFSWLREPAQMDFVRLNNLGDLI